MNEEPFTSSGVSTTTHPGAPHESGSSFQSNAQQTAQSFQSEAERLKNAAREHGAATVDQVKAGVQSAAHQAQEAGRTFFRNQQSNLAQRVSEYAQAARSASQCMSGEQTALIAGPVESAANQLERISSYLRDKEPADLLDDLEHFARRRPEVVFGGLFVVGLAAARFLKASRRNLDERTRSRAIVPTTGPGAPESMNFGPTSGIGTSGIGTTSGTPSVSTSSYPTTSPSTSSIPPTSGSSTTPHISPSTYPGSSTSTGASDCGCSAFPESSTQSNPIP